MFQFFRDLFTGSARPAPDHRVRLAVGGMEERATPASLPSVELPQAVVHEPLIQSHPTQLDIHAMHDITVTPVSRVAIVSHY